MLYNEVHLEGHFAVPASACVAATVSIRHERVTQDHLSSQAQAGPLQSRESLLSVLLAGGLAGGHRSRLASQRPGNLPSLSHWRAPVRPICPRSRAH